MDTARSRRNTLVRLPSALKGVGGAPPFGARVLVNSATPIDHEPVAKRFERADGSTSFITLRTVRRCRTSTSERTGDPQRPSANAVNSRSSRASSSCSSCLRG